MIRNTAHAFIGLVILLYMLAVIQQLDEANVPTDTWSAEP